MEFQCTTGIDALYTNFDCYQAAIVQHVNEIEQCITDYGKNVKVDVCKAMNTLMDCKANIYGKACGDQDPLDPTCNANGKLNQCPAPN
ncbi:unnamed protein product, partial [Mesorhabditis spiculigera]